LPDTLAQQLEQAIRAWEADDREAARASLDRAHGLAQAMAFV